MNTNVNGSGRLPAPSRGRAARGGLRRALGRRLLFSFVVFLLALEIALRLGGVMAQAARPRPAPVAKKPGEIHVICLGDSYTFGIGAPAGQSYPDHLQRLLDTSIPGAAAGRFRVFNLGRPGWNSAQVARAAREEAERYRADVVLILAGNNDAWNLESAATGPGRAASETAGAWRGADRLLANLRCYRLARWLLKSPAAAPPAPPETEATRRREAERERHHALVAALPDAARRRLSRGHELNAAGRVAEAAVEFAAAVEAAPDRAVCRIDLADAFRRLGREQGEAAAFGEPDPAAPEGAPVALSRADFHLRRREYAEARRWYELVLAARPEEARAAAGLGLCALDQGEFAEAASRLSAAVALDPGDAQAQGRLGAAFIGAGQRARGEAALWRSVELGGDPAFALSQLLTSAEGEAAARAALATRAAEYDRRFGRAWTDYYVRPHVRWLADGPGRSAALVARLAAAARGARAAGALAVVLGYPHGRFTAEAGRAAEEAGVPWVDPRPRFAPLEGSASRDRWFAPDGHLTGEGYALYAEEVARVLTRLLEERR
ncbi:MAG: hypothetical protein HY719_05105 [Planctomycetes bacterium]|nr:hypothetical protein [Planctomycetota bacterium]